VCASAAIEGRVLSAATSVATNWTTVSVALANVIHETTHFADLLTSSSSSSSSVPRDPPAVQSHAGAARTRDLVVRLRTASECGAGRGGEGVIVFVGTIRLRSTLHVQCARRLQEFRRVYFSAVEHHAQPCQLSVT